MDKLSPELQNKLAELRQDGTYPAQSFARNLLRQAFVAKHVTVKEFGVLVRQTYFWGFRPDPRL